MSLDPTAIAWLARPPAEFRSRCRELDGSSNSVGELVWLAGHSLDDGQLGQLHNAMRRMRKRQGSLAPLEAVRLGLLSKSTVAHLVPAIEATALRYGMDLEIVETPFGSVAQQVLNQESQLHWGRPDAVLLALDQRSLLLPSLDPQKADEAQHAVAATLAEIATVRDAVQAMGAQFLAQTLAPPIDRVLGSMETAFPGTPTAMTAAINAALYSEEFRQGAILLDAAYLAQLAGLERWYDPVMWHMAKLPFAAELAPLYAEHLCRLVAANRGRSRKCLVLDLDNTLWGGTIGDDGIENIVLGQGSPAGEAFLDIQKAAIAFHARGILLAVCSRNDPQTALLPFRQHPDMLLREAHIASFVANWGAKSENLRKIAEHLNIGIDSLVMVDDNPAERAAIRDVLPMVAVPELPHDPAFFPRFLHAAGYFETAVVSAEDARRGQLYQMMQTRGSGRSNYTSESDYLRDLEMVLTVRRFNPLDRSRIVQLVNKTNQFNLTTRRYTEAEVTAIERGGSHLGLTARLVDRYGDDGLISVIIVKKAADSWEIESWLMSCRVLGRGVEAAFLGVLAEAAKEAGAKNLIGRYVPTAKNAMVKDHYVKLGFVSNDADAESIWRLSLDAFSPGASIMKVDVDDAALAVPVVSA